MQNIANRSSSVNEDNSDTSANRPQERICFCNNNHNNNNDHRLNEIEDKKFKVDSLTEELALRNAELAAIKETMQIMDAKFKEDKWALSAEVAEKHDELSEFRRVISNLEETVRQAEVQTHYKDDIIRTMRSQLKKCNKEGPKLCDIVSEVQQKLVEDMTPQECDDAGGGGDCPARLHTEEAATPSTLTATIVSVVSLDQECQTERSEYLTPLPSPITLPPAGDGPPHSLNADNQIDDGQIEEVKGLVTAVEGMLRELSVNVSTYEGGCDDSAATVAASLRTRLDLLHHTLFQVRLPELRAQLVAEQKTVSNKEETLQNLNSMVEMREEQVKGFTIKVEELERQLEEQRLVIKELQLAVQHCKQLECEIKEKELRSLRFAVCELELNQKSLVKVSKEKEEALVNARDEKQNLKERLNSVNHDLHMLQPEVAKWRRLHLKSEKYNEKLEKNLEDRDAEITNLQMQVQKLEEEVDAEGNKSEERCRHDANVIRSLKDKVHSLHQQLDDLRTEHRRILSEAELTYLAERAHSAEQRRKLAMQNQDFQHIIRQLTTENRLLTEEAQKALLQEEECSKSLLQQGSQQRLDFERKVSEMCQELKEKEALHENACSEWELRRKTLEDERKIDLKKILELSQLLEGSKRIENELKQRLSQTSSEIIAMKSENEEFKKKLMDRDKELTQWENREMSQLDELELSVRGMSKEMISLQKKCHGLTKDLDQQLFIKKTLQHQIDSLEKHNVQLQDKCSQWNHQYKEALSSELQARKEMQMMKDEGMQRILQEVQGKQRAEKDLTSLIDEFQKVKIEYNELKGNHIKLHDALNKIRLTNCDLEKKLKQAEKEKHMIDMERRQLEEELGNACEINSRLGEKVVSLSKLREQDAHSYSIEKHRLTDKYKRAAANFDVAITKIHKYEAELIPNLHVEVGRRDKIIAALKSEVSDANRSCRLMREEAQRVIDTAAVAAQRSCPGATASRDFRTVSEEKQLFSEIQSKRAGFVNPWAPMPPDTHWARCHKQTSPDFESGFQSLVTSPSPQLDEP